MPLKTYQDELPTINLTPMLDIVFNLIIFFVVGTRFIGAESKLPVKVPEVAEAGKLNRRWRNTSSMSTETDRFRWTTDSSPPINSGKSWTAARARYAGLGVIVRGDGEGAFQNVATVLNACRQAGVSEMGISVRLPAKGG